VIEFGPLEGCLTAGLVKLGVKSLTCIEARAENAIKTLVACHAFDWKNVKLVMDDFHNVNQFKYGTYDLVFAHGVYYHSLAPFLFLENLRSSV
jgi:16S rRNA A1518/A1519 N6-dimethyltransferase RsmA/KsgA/DIM1 with predicted DNA glycosylase/AP lyase activity